VRKDYFDVVAIGRAGLSLPQKLRFFRSRFAIGDTSHTLASLTCSTTPNATSIRSCCSR